MQPNVAVLPWLAARPVVVFAGIAGVTFGTLVAVREIRHALEPAPAPTPAPEPEPEPDPEPDDGLEDWERDAILSGDVQRFSHGIFAPPPENLVQAGEGLPDELCHAVEKNPDPRGDIELVCTVDPLGDPKFAPKPSQAPFAAPGNKAIWPIDKSSRHQRRLTVSYFTEDGIRGAWGRHFGSGRKTDEGTDRRHAGIDLFANAGDVVVAPEGGRVVAILPFHHGTWAIYLRVQGGRILNLGEIQKFSWREFKIRPGMQVEKGQPLARIGQMSDGGHMLHLEMYAASDIDDEPMTRQIRRGEMQWLADQPPPRLLDPSAYLVDAATRSYRQEKVVA